MPDAQRANLKRRIAIRVVLLLLAGISLYLLAPSLLEVFSSWPELRELDPLWLGLAVFFEGVSTLAFWTLQRIAFRTQSWFAVGTSQLASAAAAKILPGGPAAAGVLQYGMLVRAGIPPQRVASGLAASWAATTATVLALPVMAVLTALGGAPVPDGLRNVAYLGGGAFVAMAAAGVGAFAWDRPLRSPGAAHVPRPAWSAGASSWTTFLSACCCSATPFGARFPCIHGWRSWPRSASGASTTSPCFACWRRFRHNRSPRSSSSRTQRPRSSA